MKRRLTALILVLVILLAAVFCAKAEQKGEGELIADHFEGLLNDLLSLNNNPETADQETTETERSLVRDIAVEWIRVYIDSDYPVYSCGKDDPDVLQIQGKHAFVILGLELENGEMAEELKGRCDAAAEAARAFPESILICSGGATGENNPDAHTEAGLMKQYLTETCGIEADRIFSDEQAMTTADNAVNTFAILKEQAVDSITVVTSSYHQCRAHMLYYTLADWYSRMEGWQVELIGNYSFDTEGDPAMAAMDAFIAEFQIREILEALYSV